ncbi:hydantoinase/oxoprolinase family protein [Rhodovarius crocodyli]|uniref:Hydantoinase/oxoprolinase family protein n=1 Tax=Rhodovarius crocodyli TaxID=1979269 RepID=A0A437M3D9_9PROT|nr:hydantoinase/oxoprolinase family protein [Rhodovarius crocodyli]RVT92210.1 hydantoinase/oxoprolinase family protein [Rhodovarius crocodyli]
MALRVGVDVGGSFTDFAVLDDADGSLTTLKVFSRPDAPGQEIVEGMRQLAARHGIQAADVGYFTHGTTVGINTVIQRNGLKLALFTTRNFEDVLELARLKMAAYHNLFSRRPDPLIPRERVFGIEERVDAEGAVLTPIEEASVAGAVHGAIASGAQGILIAFLHAWRNPAHEQAAEAMIRRLAPELPVFRSAAIWPIIREYERTMTAAISGHVQPRVALYLDAFEDRLRELGVNCGLRITKSNGGVMGAAQARAECVQMLLSGTASGVIGAAFVAQAAGLPRIMSLDIGGTSADVAVIIDGQPEYGSGEVIGDFQIHIPSVSVTSIGQGGGSIASVDEFGVLKVGPESAGSLPGPACYGRGGERPTITDAVAVSGLIGHAGLGYGAVTLDLDRAKAAVGTVAGPLGIPLEQAAGEIIELAVSGMYTDTSALVSRFGIDVREFSLLAFGGAGPMLACFLARELNMASVVVPPAPGVLSAMGGLIADLRNDFIRIVYATLAPAVAPRLAEALEGMKAQALHWLHEEQGFAGEATLNLSAEMRYRGQSHEIAVPLELDAITDIPAITRAFHDRHRVMFGHADEKAAVQLITLRLVVAGATPKPRLRPCPPAEGPAEPDRLVPVYLDGAHTRAALYRREALRAGHTFPGPAIIAQPDCTTCVPAGFTVRVDGFGNLIIAVPEKAA